MRTETQSLELTADGEAPDQGGGYDGISRQSFPDVFGQVTDVDPETTQRVEPSYDMGLGALGNEDACNVLALVLAGLFAKIVVECFDAA